MEVVCLFLAPVANQIKLVLILLCDLCISLAMELVFAVFKKWVQKLNKCLTSCSNYIWNENYTCTYTNRTAMMTTTRETTPSRETTPINAQIMTSAEKSETNNSYDIKYLCLFLPYLDIYYQIVKAPKSIIINHKTQIHCVACYMFFCICHIAYGKEGWYYWSQCYWKKSL